MVVKKRIVKSKKKSQKKVQQRRSRKKTSKRVSKRRSQRRSRKRVSKKKSPKRSLKVRRSRTKSQKKLIVRRKNSRRRKRSNKKQRGGASATYLRQAIMKRLEGNAIMSLKVNKLFNKSLTRDVEKSFEKLLVVAEDKEFLRKIKELVKSQTALSRWSGPNKRSINPLTAPQTATTGSTAGDHAFKMKRAVGVKLSQISWGLTALAGPALYYGGWYLVNKLDIYIPGLGRTLGLISMGMALQKTGITNTLVNKGGQISSVAIESIHSLSNAAIGRIYRTSRATNKIIKVIGDRISASKRALMGLNPDTSLYLRFKPEDSVGPHGETLVAVDVAETNTRFVPIPGKFMIDDAGNLVQVEVLVTRPNIHVKFVGEDDFAPAAMELADAPAPAAAEDDFAPAAMELADAPAPAAAEESEIHLTTIGVNPKEEEALFAMAKSAILDQPEPATAAAAAATVELDEERAEALAANLGLDTYMKEYIEGNMVQVAASVKEGRTLDLNGVVLEVLEAIKQVQEAATSGVAELGAEKGALEELRARGKLHPNFKSTFSQTSV